MDDVADYNRKAWDAQVDRGGRWSTPAPPADIAAARAGELRIVLTPAKRVPAEWWPPLVGCRVLCLAGAGGQQGPILAAAGAAVTVYDNSPKQLGQDRFVAAREGLDLATVLGDMRNLAAFADGAFDLVVHPCSNNFVPDIRPVWREAARVLRPGGTLLAGFFNPLFWLFDDAAHERGELAVRHSLPYSDTASLTAAERQKFLDADEPLCFGHTLTDQLAGQTDAGLAIVGLYEDIWGERALDKFSPSFLATRAVKRPEGR